MFSFFQILFLKRGGLCQKNKKTHNSKKGRQKHGKKRINDKNINKRLQDTTHKLKPDQYVNVRVVYLVIVESFVLNKRKPTFNRIFIQTFSF